MADLVGLTRHFASRGDVVLLHSQLQNHSASQVSYLAALPSAVIKACGDMITIVRNGEETVFREDPWAALQTFRARNNSWLFGYLGYDLKNYVEKLNSSNPDPIGAPDMYFMIPRFLLEVNHKTGNKKVIKGKMPNVQAIEVIAKSQQQEFSIGDIELQTNRQSYLKKIEEAQYRIKEGDFYEINLSHRMSTVFSGSPFQLYKNMLQAGPVPFGSFLQVQDLTVCCQSPERFLLKEGTTVFSQPIKGTARRGTTNEEDEHLIEALSTSEKEQAENLMIVDLVRNDLSRIARKGSVKVPELFAIQSFGTVHHMVSTIIADAEETDPVIILKACFPMGSMTGAPKISAMKSIEELEDYKRGIYSGAIGYIAPDDNFDFNVVIRTAVIKNGRLYYAVGGAITADSNCQHEWGETQIKARALVDAIIH